eukprot:3069851-Prymnesium_polylepis.1
MSAAASTTSPHSAARPAAASRLQHLREHRHAAVHAARDHLQVAAVDVDTRTLDRALAATVKRGEHRGRVLPAPSEDVIVKLVPARREDEQRRAATQRLERRDAVDEPQVVADDAEVARHLEHERCAERLRTERRDALREQQHRLVLCASLVRVSGHRIRQPAAAQQLEALDERSHRTVRARELPRVRRERHRVEQHERFGRNAEPRHLERDGVRDHRPERRAEEPQGRGLPTRAHADCEARVLARELVERGLCE